MRILFLNQYFPPDPAPTGVLLADIAEALRAGGHEVLFASAEQEYRGGRKGSRLLRELRGLWTIFRRALRAGPVDVVISATSPPMLAVPAALIAKWRGARHLHWLFDMYPEIAVALGEIRAGALAGLLSRATRWGYRNAEKVVVLDEDMAARLPGIRTEILPPWVLRPLLDARAAQVPAPAPSMAGRAPVWLYSGNLGRAHEWETLLEAQRLLESGPSLWKLVFQGGGPAWNAARDRAAALGLKRCEWRPYVPENELPAALLAADVLAVTQRPETCGLLWPSKLALAASLPRPILWVGPKDRAIARQLARLPASAVFAPGEARAIAAYLTRLAQGAENGLSTPLEAPALIRQRGLEQWLRMVAEAR